MKSLHFDKGDIYYTKQDGVSYKIKEGALDIFLVPFQGQEPGRRILIHEAKAKETIPGVDFTDKNYIEWSFCFKALEDTEVVAVEGGVTSVLKNKFAQKAELVNYEEEGFEDSIVEKYDELKIKEDIEIQKKEQAKDKARIQRQEAVERIAGINSAGQEESNRDASEVIVPTYSIADSLRKVVNYTMVNTSRRDLVKILLWVLCGSGAGIVLLLFAGQPYMSVLASIVLAACLYMIGKEVYAVSIDAASEQQRIAYGRVFELEERVFRNYGRTDVAGLCMNIYDISKTSMTAGLQFLSSILLCLIIIIASAVFLPVESALFILASLFIGIVMVVCRIRASGYNKTVAKARSRATDRLYQYIRNISKVKISGSEENILRDYYMMRSEMMPERIRASRLTNVSDVLRVLLLCGVLPITAAFVLKYIGISIIGLILCTAYFMLLMMQIVKMPLLAEDLGKAELLLSGAEEKTKGSIDTIDEIEIDHISFAYGQKNVIQDFSFSIRKGECVGLIGDSGSGKTTLLKLLTGIEKPSAGEIRINGINIDEIDMKTARRKMSLIMQDGALVTGSLLENIRMDSDASAERVLEAIKQADLGDFLSSLPMGLETVLEEDAGNISSGQKQKILIARALLREPDLIIMDESMSEMDNSSIDEICKSLKESEAAKIIVSHRIEPLSICDKIIEMKTVT